MGTELNEIIEKAKRLAERERVVKEQPINCKYRNKLYYNNVFKQVGVDEAFEIVARNIKKPTFKYELDIALETFKDFYGVPFMSKQERQLSEAEIENERLRKELEELKAAKAAVAEKTVDEEKKPIDFSEFPKNMDKEAFKVFFAEWHKNSQGVKPNGGQQTAAWNKYLKANEVPVQ